MIPRVLTICALTPLLVLDTAMPGGHAHPQALRIAHQSADEWVIEYRHQPMRFVELQLEGKSHLLFTDGGAPESSREGQPHLPALVLSLGIRFGDSVAAEVTEARYAAVENQLVAPVPGYRYTEDGEAIPVYKKDEGAYAMNTLSPSGC